MSLYSLIAGIIIGTSALLIPIIVFIALASIKIVKEYERGVKFTLGKFSGIMGPGLNFVIPAFQSWQRIDIRTKVIDVPDQECITKDNVSVKVNAVLYYLVNDAKKAVIEVDSYGYAISQLAQTTMRNVIGEATLDELLSERDKISKRILELVDEATDPWGIKIEAVELKHIELPESMQRVMAKQAEAEREKRAVIIKAKGELSAAENIAKAAKQLSETPGALHLRTLHSINDLSSDKSYTEVYVIPAEALRALKKLGSKLKA